MDRIHLETEILIIGAGAAGMAAALAAAEDGARVILADRSLIGRSGATVMAQMTVAVAMGEEEPDSPEFHYTDTMTAGRGLCDPRLARLVCEQGPAAIRKLDGWKVGWARHADGRMRQAHAPGHDRPRCVYVDFLSTGPAVSKTLRTQLQRQQAIRRIGDLVITDLVVENGAALGAVGFSVADGRAVTIAARVTIIATGGLTRLYRRNSGSSNMGGDGFALALRAGAELIDMEFVQFFPIGHLAPRMIGMDPIMWDPFRYKLGGRLLNAERREFMNDYGVAEAGHYVGTRDMTTYSILKEVQAGRGSPAGGAYLSFEHVPPERLCQAFGPVIDRLAANGIDLTRMPVEVAPIAHYHMGGIRVAPDLATGVPNLLAAGEAVGGSNGANRLSGNAITEALVFGEATGRAATRLSRAVGRNLASPAAMAEALALVERDGPEDMQPARDIADLQAGMAELVGPSRSADGLAQALRQIGQIKARAGDRPPGRPGGYDLARLDWFDLRTMLLVAEAVTMAALARTESRGAHQREDHPGSRDEWLCVQSLTLREGELQLARLPAMAEPAQAAEAAQ